MNLSGVNTGRINLVYQIEINRGETRSEIYCTKKKALKFNTFANFRQ